MYRDPADAVALVLEDAEDELPEPWAGTVTASLQLIDELDEQISGCESELSKTAT